MPAFVQLILFLLLMEHALADVLQRDGLQRTYWSVKCPAVDNFKGGWYVWADGIVAQSH